MKPRHVPMRTCTGCRQQRPKREMVRVVHALDDHVRVDPTGKVAGRGAYICAQSSCWQSALKTGSLSKVLKTSVKDVDVAELRTFAASIHENNAVETPLSSETAMR